MIHGDGNGGTVIPSMSPSRLYTILSILVLICLGVGYVVRGSAAQEYQGEKIDELKETVSNLPENYMPRNEIDTNFKLIAEQQNRIEQKIDMVLNFVNVTILQR